MPTSPRDTRVVRVTAAELNHIKNILDPQVYEFLERLTHSVIGIRGNLDGSILTALPEPGLPGSRQAEAGDNITLLDRIKQAKFRISAADAAEAAAAASGRPVYEDDFQPIIFEDYDGGVLYYTLYSTWHWYDVNSNAALIGSGTSNAGYPGRFTYRSAAGSTHVMRPYQINSPNWFLNTDSFDSYITFAQDYSGGTNTSDVRVGYVGNISSAMPPANGIYFETLAADTNWFLVTRAAGAQTRTDTGVARDDSSTMHKFRLRRVNGTTIGATVDAGSEVTATANIPTANAANLDPFFSIVTGATGIVDFNIDLWRIFITGLGSARGPAML